MENKSKIYIVKYVDSHSEDEVLAYFSIKEKAIDFLNRFKTKSTELEIVENILDPEFVTNKDEDPYLVSFKGINEMDPLDSDIYDYIEQAVSAQNQEYSVSFLKDDSINDGYFEIMLFAASKKEAVANALKKRDEVVASGEWEKAYLGQRK